MRRLGVLFCAALLTACSDGSTEEDVGGTRSESVSAENLADELGCEATSNADVPPDEPIEPSDALDCRVGESDFGIRLYNSEEDRDEVMTYLHQFAGVRVVGQNWIVAVDTPEAGERAAELLDGEFVTLRGTTTG